VNPDRLSLKDATDLVVRALVANRVDEANARSTAAALIAAEADGQRGHGLSRVSSYAAQARSGKIDGYATPVVEQPASALLRIDARSGFAYPAIDLACQKLPALADVTGIAAACIFNSHHFGQAGAHAERLAAQGLVALVLSNSPKAITFWGGTEPMMGTNPIAFAAPCADAEPLIIDLALSKVARGKILAAKRDGKKIPDNWALDADGKPTDDPSAAMAGSMLPIGDAKGAALVLVVELLTAALTGSNFGYEASSFFEGEGSPPHIGHTIIVFRPNIASGGLFAERVANIIGAIDNTEGARLPGTSRLSHRQLARESGLAISPVLQQELATIIETGTSNG
jgi:(2R)-3-sulfolactate dehydrogenase (NADP+)